MKLRTIQVFGYGAGDAANNLAFSLSGMFLLVYYTDSVGLSAGAVGTLFLVVRVWDAFTDLFAGQMVDRTQTRLGKFRPFILFGSLPLLLLSAAVFHVPGFSGGAQLVYAYVTYALLGLAYSLVNIPFGSLATVMAQAPRDRARLGAARGVGTHAVILLMVVIVSPALSEGSDLQGTLSTVTLSFVVVGMVLYLFTFLTSRENVKRDVPRIGMRETFAALKGNRPLLLLCVGSVVYLFGLFAFQAVGVYYSRDVLGDPGLFVWLTVISTVAAVAVAPLVPRIVQHLGKKGTFLAGAAVQVVGGTGLFLAPADPLLLPMTAWALGAIGMGVINAVIWALEADTVEYGEWRSGVRAEGATYAVFSFTRKIGQAVGSALAAYALGVGGYAASAAHQSSDALTAIRFAAGGAPALMALTALAIMWFYPLDEHRFRQVVADIAARRAGEESADLSGGSPSRAPAGAEPPAPG